MEKSNKLIQQSQNKYQQQQERFYPDGHPQLIANVTQSKFSPSASNLLSRIFQPSKKHTPQFIRNKNNLLLIMLCLTTVGIYYLFSDFVNVMLLAFIGEGLGYQQMRQRFISFWVKRERLFETNMSIIVRIIYIFLFLLLITFLPWIKDFLATPEQYNYHFQIEVFLKTLKVSSNFVVLFLQLLLLIRVMHLVLSQSQKQINSQSQKQINSQSQKQINSQRQKQINSQSQKQINSQSQKQIYKIIFGLGFFIIAIGALIIIPSVFLMQISNGRYLLEAKFKQHFKCSFSKNVNQPSEQQPLCTDVLFKNNTYVTQVLNIIDYENRAQAAQVQECMSSISGIENKFSNFKIFKYKELICTWSMHIQKVINYFTLDMDMVSTGTIFVKTVLGNILQLLMSFSNIIFDVTTFITIFCVTVQNFNPHQADIKVILQQRKGLIQQITNLIQASILILVEHFFMSIILLELFNFSHFNLIISTLLSSMAFVPFFRPWFGMLFFCVLRSLFTYKYTINIILLAVYYYLSEMIFSKRLKKMQFHQVITNLSILFGIYQFGIAGIFYGPILLILFKTVQRQLLKIQQ